MRDKIYAHAKAKKMKHVVVMIAGLFLIVVLPIHSWCGVNYPYLDNLPNNSSIKKECSMLKKAWFFKGSCQKSCEQLEYILTTMHHRGNLPLHKEKPFADSDLAPFAYASFLRQDQAVQRAIKILVKDVYVEAELHNFIAYALFLYEKHIDESRVL